MKVVYFLVCLVLAISCGNSKKTKVMSSTTEVPTNQNSYRLIVSFISKASGPDVKAIEQLFEFIKEVNTKNNVEIAYEKFPWGREGESDYCFQLNELSKDKQETFVKELKNKLAQSDRVIFEENTACRHKR